MRSILCKILDFFDSLLIHVFHSLPLARRGMNGNTLPRDLRPRFRLPH